MIHFIHRKLRLEGIITRFFFWVIVIVFLTSFTYLLTYSAVDKKMRADQIKNSLRYSLSMQVATLENWTKDREEEVVLLSSFPVTKELDYEVMAARFNYFDHYYDQLNSIVYIDSDGYIRLDTGLDDTIVSDESLNVSDRDYFKVAEEGERSVYIIIEKLSTGEEAVIFASPVETEEGDFNGVLLTAVHLDRINEILSEMIQGDTGKITLATKDGEIISQLTKDASITFGSEREAELIDGTLFHDIQKAEEGFFEYKNKEGVDLYSVFSPLLDKQFILINEIETKEVLAPHNQMVFILSLMTMLIIIIAFVLFQPVTHSLLQPFNYLLHGIDRMKEGAYNTQLHPEKFATSPKELQQMMEVFNEMAVSINRNKRLLKQLSNTDGLTGIANRRLFEEHLQEQWERCYEQSIPISLIFIDIDHFKKYNDTFGHLEGDRCLIRIAQALERLLEHKDSLIARYGGEEFVIVLPTYTLKKAEQLALEIQRKIRNLSIKRSLDKEDEFVTVSIGIATTIPTSLVERETLIKKADDAVYEAKSQGRNTIIAFEM